MVAQSGKDCAFEMFKCRYNSVERCAIRRSLPQGEMKHAISSRENVALTADHRTIQPSSMCARQLFGHESTRGDGQHYLAAKCPLKSVGSVPTWADGQVETASGVRFISLQHSNTDHTLLSIGQYYAAAYSSIPRFITPPLVLLSFRSHTESEALLEGVVSYSSK